MNDWHKLFERLQKNTPNTAESQPVELMPLSNHCILRVSGENASSFLQGQVTCDVQRLSQADCVWGAHCNHKGRMLGSFLLAGVDHHTLLLRVRRDIAEPLQKSLAKYAVFSKVKVELLAWELLAIKGGMPETMPNPGKSAAISAGLLVRPTLDLVEFWLSPGAAQELSDYLNPSVKLASATDFDRYWIQQGIAEVQGNSFEEYIPQMFNFDVIDGISFKKGCYTGQEIVARMQFRGQLKKHTYALTSDQPLDINVGEQLVGEGDLAKALAVVVASAVSDNSWSGLVVANREVRMGEPHLLEKKSGAKLTWAQLPYAIPNSES
jgi:tRNA-modifying protein YgfZ